MKHKIICTKFQTCQSTKYAINNFSFNNNLIFNCNLPNIQLAYRLIIIIIIGEQNRHKNGTNIYTKHT